MLLYCCYHYTSGIACGERKGVELIQSVSSDISHGFHRSAVQGIMPHEFDILEQENHSLYAVLLYYKKP